MKALPLSVFFDILADSSFLGANVPPAEKELLQFSFTENSLQFAESDERDEHYEI
jgi:hypothetical protein